MSDDDSEIEIITPQFRRPKGSPIPALAPENFADVLSMDANALREMGCRPWNQVNDPEDEGVFPKDTVLWLFPGEWYEGIPEGFPIVDINGHQEKFEKGETDNDIRFGCLAYGVLVLEKEKENVQSKNQAP